MIRISVVKYLNAVPLAWGILEGPGRDYFEPVFSTPAECAAQLASGTVDIGLIPSIAYQRIPGSRIIPGPAVASPRRALSVLLLSLLPLSRVRTVGCDTSSRTSEALARIVFAEFCRTYPEFHPAAPDIPSMLANNDAAVIIGDVALAYQAENRLAGVVASQRQYLRYGPEPAYSFDLAERWNYLTGLPFVFAFWAARPGFKDPTAVTRLVESREYGLAQIDRIADRYAETLHLEREFVRQYLTINLDYHMDANGIEALRAFYDLAGRHRVLRRVRRLEFL